jgi:Fe-S cluster assembly iron-binding protein IscA
MRADSGAELILQDCQKQLDRARRGGNWFSRGGDSLNHGTFQAQLAPYHDRVYYEGRVAWAALVMANPRLYLLGEVDSTGTVVYSFDKEFDAEPQTLVRIAGTIGSLKNNMPKDPILVAFAAEVRNDSPREIDRLVPPALTSSRPVRYETIYIQRHRLPTRYLAHTLFPVIVAKSQPTQVMLLPCELWAQELVDQWHERARLSPPARETSGGISAGQYEDLGGVVSRGGIGSTSSDDAPGPFGRPNPPTAAQSIHRQAQQAIRAQSASDDAYTEQQARQAYAESHQRIQPANPAPRPAPQPAAPTGQDRSAAFAQNPLRLTQAAAAGLRLMQRQQGLNGVKVRVSVGQKGYEVDFTEDEPQPAVDFMYICDGITLLVDRDSAALLTGVQMDLVHSPQGMGFVFRSAA